MTDEELENEAEEYALGMMGNKYDEFCKLEQTYIDAHKKGYEEGRKEPVLDLFDKCEKFRHKNIELEKENEELKCCANCNDYLASVCKCNKIGEYRICDSVCKDWN